MVDYLSKIESLKDKVQKGKSFSESLGGKKNYREIINFRNLQRYKEVHHENFDIKDYSKNLLRKYELGDKKKPSNVDEKEDALLVGSRLFQVSAETNNPEMALDAIKMYELLGKSNRKSVKKRFMRVLQSSDKISPEVYNKAKEYFEKCAKEEKSKGGLEGKITGIFGLLFLAGIFFSSSNITGNAIGISQNSMNFFGIGLMLLAVVGFFIYRKMNQ